ncbi:MAG: TIGR02206 family membrane protein [Candidatus Omnitrophota bacterium]|nr:TIGR02206 family membrane protein [Candidatus Omnitrophota bacterium]
MREAGPFVPGGADHLTVLALMAGGVITLCASRRRLQLTDDLLLRRGVAGFLLANEALAWILAAVRGVIPPPAAWTNGPVSAAMQRMGPLGPAAGGGMIWLPLQLCDLTVLVTIWALWSARPLVSELAYFWALAGSLQAILTPDLRYRFPEYWWVKFFLTHVGVVVSVVYLALTGRVSATHRSVWRVWGWTNLYAAAAGGLNWIFGTNYGYLAHKPAQPSLLDYAGPWPYYVLVMEGLALAFLYLWYAPFVFVRRHITRTS